MRKKCLRALLKSVLGAAFVFMTIETVCIIQGQISESRFRAGTEKMHRFAPNAGQHHMLKKSLLGEQFQGHHQQPAKSPEEPYSTFPWKKNFSNLKRMNLNTTSAIGIQQQPFVHVPGYDLFIHRAVAGNTSGSVAWDIITITGWWHFHNSVNNFNCCLLYSDGVVISNTLFPYKRTYMYEVPLEGKQVKCFNPRHSVGDVPTGVSLTHKNKICSLKLNQYVPPYKALKTGSGSIGVCTKVAYGNLSAQGIVEWFEVHRKFGVNTVITYIDKSLTEGATKVFSYYESIGMLKTFDFVVPFQDQIRRKIGDKNPQSWSDENLSTLDCQERLRGHTYVGVMDFDEFLVPTKHPYLASMLDDLFDSHSDAAGFTFDSVVYLKEWGQAKKSEPFLVSRYTYRTEPIDDRRKYVAKIERVRRGTMFTHDFKPKKGFKQYKCPNEVALLRHYRSCRKSWAKNGKCLYDKKINDVTIGNILESLREVIVEVKSKVFADWKMFV